MPEKTVGLVLSGGGARGAAHLGVLKALNELNIKITAISGVSAGAVIGALFSAGLLPEAILKELKQLSYFGISNIAWFKNGFFTMAGLQKKLMQLIGHNELKELPIPLYVTATDITKGQSVTFSQGSLSQIIIASCSVPVIFEPVTYMDCQLQDGGILNNFPIEPLEGKYDLIIGSHVNKMSIFASSVKQDRTALIDQCFHLAIRDSIRHRTERCDICIEPLLPGIGMFDMKDADKIFSLGYDSTMLQGEKLTALYHSFV